MSASTVWIPRDAAALAAGADDVADALIAVAAERDRPLSLVRNGSRGLLWLEPLLEVATPAGRRSCTRRGPCSISSPPSWASVWT